MIRTPFKHHIPRDFEANLTWRARTLERALEDREFRSGIVSACEEDPIFWMNGFGWTYDPRPDPQRRKRLPKLPFILYEFQEEAFLRIINAIGMNDLLIEKARDMGASWLCVSAMTWYWLFRPMQSFLFVSRVEDYVDKAGNPKALFWKFDFLIDNMPIWLRPAGYKEVDHRRKLHVENPENGSVIDGESTTGRVARGDRRTAILLDEFAAVEQGYSVLSATRDATTCRIFNSTPQGTANAFYTMRESGIERLRLHWPAHPLKGRGLYTTAKDGSLEVLDKDGYPDDYKPILDGKVRSPWYDVECERAATPQEIAQELDIDYLGSGFQFFKQERVQVAITRYARPPIHVGEILYDEDTGDPIEFRENLSGPLKLWCLIDDDKNEPLVDQRLAFGADVSAGTGASNSCLVGYGCTTHEKIFEYASPYCRPEEFAKLSVAVARWFKQKSLKSPFLLWEANGPGRQYGSRVLELGYTNVYMRRNDASITKKVSDIPGWAPTKESKLLLLGEYRSALENMKVINRSREALEETLEYVFLPNGSIAHSRATDKTDPSGANANHGDRAMADALAWKGVHERRVGIMQKEQPEVPIGSLAWRREMREKKKRPATEELGEGW